MNRRIFPPYPAVCAIATGVLLVGVLLVPSLRAQKEELQQRVADLKESMARNKQALTQYTWVETVTIYLKGEQKKQQHSQVRLGPDGKPQKTSLDPAPAAQDQSGGRRGGRLKEQIVQKKKEEYEDYAERMKSLITRYVPPEKEALQDAYAAGNVSVTPAPGGGDLVSLLIKNYVKPGDTVTLIFDKGQKQLMQYAVNTYLDDASDVIKLTVNFDRVPNGPSHVSEVIVESVSKQLKVNTDNSQYAKLQ
ncbi:MAG TPA: hypothetical protein VLX60_03710 [Terriglobales bacterium]|nr:hypothetical protein [Terriglobales bacterium]